MIHKSGVAIVTIYQAVNATADLIDIDCDVYDEAYAKDVAKSGTMVEIETNTGRYYHSWTPDAAGVWSVQIVSTSLGGKATKTYIVKAADEFGIITAVDALNDIATSDLDTALGTYDAPTKAEMDTGHGLLTTPAEVATELETYDAPTKAELDVLGTAALGTATALQTVDDELATVDGVVDDILVDTAAIDTATGATGGIRGADSDSLKDLSDQIDGIASPAMVG